MNENIFWIIAAKIKEGEIGHLRTLIKTMTDATKADEPGALNYEWFISSDDKFCHLYERYSDSNTTILHINNFAKNFAKEFMSILEIKSFNVYGDPSEELIKMMKPLGVIFMSPAGGFIK